MLNRRKTMWQLLLVGALALPALCVSGCSSEDTSADTSGLQPWYFSFSTGDMATRGKPEDTLTRSVGVSSYVFDHEGTLGKPNFMWNEEVCKGGSVWRTKNAFGKPDAGKDMKFMAYYPYAAQEDDPQLKVSDNNVSGPAVIEYEVPTVVADQQDVMTGESDVVGTDVENAGVQITMKHRLAAIQFITGDIGLAGKIVTITLKGIYKKGTYRLGDSQWTLSGTPTGVSFTVRPEYVVEDVTLATDPDGKKAITEDENTFLMLPQEIPDDAKMVIEFEATIDGETATHTLEANLKSESLSRWDWGKVYKYKISVVSLALEYSLETHDWEGGRETDVINGEVKI